MKKFVKPISVLLVLTVMMGLMTACQNKTKTASSEQNKDKTPSSSEKVVHYKVNWRLDNYGQAYPISIYQYNKDGKIAYSYTGDDYNYPELTVYGENTDYIIRLKYTKIAWSYSDLAELAKDYDYKNDYHGKIDYEYSGNKVSRETQYYPNGTEKYRYKTLVTEYTRNNAGLVTRKVLTGTGSTSGEADLREVYEYEYDANGNVTKQTINGKPRDGVLEERFDEHNNTILIVYDDGSKTEYKRTYNSKGLLATMERIVYKADGSVGSKATDTYEYDDHDNVILDKGSLNDITGETRHEYKYDEKGKITYHRSYYSDSNGHTNEKIESYEFTYDADGYLIKEKDLSKERNWTEYRYWGEETQEDDRTTESSEPDQTINTIENTKNLAGFVRTSDYPLTPGAEKDEIYTIIGKAMKIDDWFDELEWVYIDEVTPESLEKVTAELVASGCRAIIFDIGDLTVYGQYRETLAAKYPNVMFYPKV